ncbi:MAG: group II truncated hemoglobin [Bdellovibrionaceae bacterium]|nr:group II truncated hemoglobin [Pseudobdellovibrionaceae bacterium]
MSSVYEAIGGELTIRNLVERFYFHMDTLPEAKSIREMHGADLTPVKEKLFMYLSGWLGGPNLFEEKFGHPRLRARHLPFKIDKPERDQWMICMVHAFDDVQVMEPYRSEILHSLLNLADHMRNQSHPGS